ncbi:MAG: metallopeptidase TldD-related protein [candidate division WOR-3 bacterium]|nr:metallopeptidase TldD-related protein [candidate division WOR-3 bacterium]
MKVIKYLILSLAICSLVWAAPQNPILSAMQSELNRCMQNLEMEGHQKPYFISYRVTDQTYVTVEASLGAVTQSDESRNRRLSVDLRVGSYELDNSGVKKQRWSYDPDEWKYSNMQVPIDDDTTGLKHQLWLATDYYYKKAVEDYAKKSKEIALNPEEEERPPDFSQEDPEVYIGDETRVLVDRKEWEPRIKRCSALFAEYEDILISRVRFDAQAKTVYFVSSEGSKIQDGDLLYSIEIEACTRAEDGMPLRDFQRFYSYDGTFDEAQIEAEITRMAERILTLRDAEACEQYAGPVLIEAQASGAFVSAVLAPLLKADKKLWEKGGGLQNKVGQRVILPSISVYDDPTIDTYKGLTLVGHYRFDDQGVAAQKVNLIEKGVLRNFLLSRAPVKGFDKSNGHSRDGVQIGNLILESSASQTFAQLKSRLIAECKRQDKPYGLLVTSVRLPESRSGRRVIYSFSGENEGEGRRVLGQFQPVAIYKVYTDGREELLRGVQVLSSSPLATLGKIIAVGNDTGAWSTSFGTGSVVAPSILVSELEVRKTKESTRTLPILPPPGE